MANIKNLQMWNDICADSRISVSKSMFGFKTTVSYVHTQSVIDARTIEFSPADGDKLKSIIETPIDGLEKAIGNYHPKEVANGNYLLEIAHSRDGEFVALRLLQFVQLAYEPVTKTIIFEAAAARIINKLF